MWAYYHHQKFHEEMIHAMVSQFNREEAEFLAKSVDGLISYFQSSRKSYAGEDMAQS